MEMRFDMGMPFTTHIYLDVREEGVEFSVVDNLLIKPGHGPEAPPAPGGLMPASTLTMDDYDRGVNVRFWKSGQINLNLALEADQALAFVGRFIAAFLAAHVNMANPSESDPVAIANKINELIEQAAVTIAGEKSEEVTKC